jgi:hypothetical protein
MRFGFVSQFTSKGLPPSSANDCLKSRNCPNSNPDGNPWRQFACWGCHLNTGFARAFEEPRIISAGETGQCTSVTTVPGSLPKCCDCEICGSYIARTVSSRFVVSSFLIRNLVDFPSLAFILGIRLLKVGRLSV